MFCWKNICVPTPWTINKTNSQNSFFQTLQIAQTYLHALEMGLSASSFENYLYLFLLSTNLPFIYAEFNIK